MNEKKKLPECANAPGCEFTAEEMAQSLRVCHTSIEERYGCTGCIYAGNSGYIAAGRLNPKFYETCCKLEPNAADLIEAQAKRIAELEELVEDRTKDVLFYVEQEKWIPTSERLPRTDDGPFHVDGELSAVSVLAVIEGAEWGAELYFDGYEFFDIQGEELIPYRVTHWKPMPKGADGA